MTRTPLLVANWKMNKAPAEAAILAQDILNRLDLRQLKKRLELVFCPPYVDLSTVATVIRYEHAAIGLGAQDVFWQPNGAFTGAISAAMLAQIGCEYCIIGHSERRQWFAETDADIQRKLRALAAAGIRPILCLGESLELRQAGAAAAQDFVLGQMRAALTDPVSGQLQPPPTDLVIGYEPVWSIGSGQTATPGDAQDMAAALRAELTDLFDEELATSVRIIYGGSLLAANIALFIEQPDIDGGLVGSASLEADEFSALVRAVLTARLPD